MNLTAKTLAISLSLAASLSAQSNFGVSCPGSNGKNSIVSYPANAWMAFPSEGEKMTIVDGVPGAPAVLMIGRHPSGTVNVDLTAIGMPGCFQYVTPFKFLAVDGGILDVNGAGTATLPIVPQGQEFSFQWIYLDPNAPRVLGVSASDGLVASMPDLRSAFRITGVALADPHVFTNQGGCTDITASTFDPTLNTFITSDGDFDTLLDASLMFSFRPLDPNSSEGIMDFVLPDCTAPLGTTVCTLPTIPELRVHYTNSLTTCLDTVPGTTNWPVLTSTTGPCFISEETDLTLNLNGVIVPLQNAQIGGKYVGNPPTEISEGLVRGFLPESVADATFLPGSFPLVGGQALSAILAGGATNCSSTDARDTGPDGQTLGWWIYLNYTAETANVTVQSTNLAPITDAGPDQTVDGSVNVDLDGSGSSDPDMDPITFSWVQTAGPIVSLTGANTVSPSFTSPAMDTVLTFKLTVSDGVFQSSDTVDITVQTVPVVSYATDVHPIWSARGCTNCHGNAGGLTLSGNAAASFLEVIDLVDLGTPANSEILTKPLAPAQGGVNHNGGTYFATTSDVDYQTILAWITQGANNN